MKALVLSLVLFTSNALSAPYIDVTQDWCESNFKNTTMHLVGGSCSDLVFAKKMSKIGSQEGFENAAKIALNNVDNLKRAYISQKDITGKVGENTLQLMGAYSKFFKVLNAGYSAMSNKAMELGKYDLAVKYKQISEELNAASNEFEIVID